MGFLDGPKKFLFGKWVGKTAREAMMGKLGAGPKLVWTFLDGWKSWIVALILAYKLWCHGCASGSYLDVAVNALGWSDVQGAFDPKEFLLAVGFLVAVGHRLLKAIKQFRAGVPVALLNSPGVDAK